MGDTPVVSTLGAGAGTGADTGAGAGGGAGAGEQSPRVTFGGGTGQVTPPAKSEPKAGGEEKLEPFKFSFDGDTEEYVEKLETEADKTAGDKDIDDYNKPLDPLLKEALKDKPELLKQVERNYFTLRNWQAKSGFRTPQEVTKFRGDVDGLAKSLGRNDGKVGLDAIRAESQEWATTMTAFSAGDPAVIEQFFADNPKGMTKLMGPALAKLSTVNPAAFSHEIGKILMATFNANDASGQSVIGAFNALVDAVGSDPANAKLLNRIHSTLDALYKASATAPEAGTAKDPKLDAREQAIQSKERQQYLGGVAATGKTILDKAVDQGIAKAFGGRKLSEDAKADLRANIIRLLQASLAGDETYKRNSWDLLESQSTDEFIKVLKSGITRNLPTVLRKQMRIFSGLGGGNAERKAEGASHQESGAGASSGGPTRMRYTGQLSHGGIPPELIDYGRMRAKLGRDGTAEMLGRREAFLKGKGETIYTW